MDRITGIALVLMLVLGFSGAQGQEAPVDSTLQAEIDHLFFTIGGARRCRLMTANGLQEGMKTIVDFKQIYGEKAGKVNSAEDFIAQVASTDAASGKPYNIQCRRSGEKIQTPMSEWLQAELDEYRTASVL